MGNETKILEIVLPRNMLFNGTFDVAGREQETKGFPAQPIQSNQ